MNDDGLVYFLADTTRKGVRVKIGCTRNLKARLAQLTNQTMSRQQPVVLALVDGFVTTERELHGTYASQWIIGEWFAMDGPLREDLYSMEDPIAFLAGRPHLWQYGGGWMGFDGWTGRPPPGVCEARSLPVDDAPEMVVTTHPAGEIIF